MAISLSWLQGRIHYVLLSSIVLVVCLACFTFQVIGVALIILGGAMLKYEFQQYEKEERLRIQQLRGQQPREFLPPMETNLLAGPIVVLMGVACFFEGNFPTLIDWAFKTGLIN